MMKVSQVNGRDVADREKMEKHLKISLFLRPDCGDSEGVLFHLLHRLAFPFHHQEGRDGEPKIYAPTFVGQRTRLVYTAMYSH